MAFGLVYHLALNFEIFFVKTPMLFSFRLTKHSWSCCRDTVIFFTDLCGRIRKPFNELFSPFAASFVPTNQSASSRIDYHSLSLTIMDSVESSWLVCAKRHEQLHHLSVYQLQHFSKHNAADKLNERLFLKWNLRLSSDSTKIIHHQTSVSELTSAHARSSLPARTKSRASLSFNNDVVTFFCFVTWFVSQYITMNWRRLTSCLLMAKIEKKIRTRYYRVTSTTADFYLPLAMKT